MRLIFQILYRNHSHRKGVYVMKLLNCLALTVTIIGALNWGLIGFFNFNLVGWIFGDMTLLSKIIYMLVGICGLYLITFYGRLDDEE